MAAPVAPSVKAVPADQQRTEITPFPFSYMAAWEVDSDSQELWSNIISSPLGVDLIGYLREFALSIAGPAEGMNGDRLAGIQQGARLVVEELLNMTKDRQTHIKARILQRRAAQVPVGMPPSKRLGKPEEIKRTRLSGPIPPKEDQNPEPPNP